MENNNLTTLFSLYQCNVSNLLELYKEEKANKNIIELMEQTVMKAGKKLAIELELVDTPENPRIGTGKDSLI